MRLNVVSFQTGGFNIQIYSNGNLGMGKFDMLGVPRRMGIDSGGSRSRPTVSSRVGESKILRHSERACPLGCISARSRLGPPTTHYTDQVLHSLILCDTVRTLLGVEAEA